MSFIHNTYIICAPFQKATYSSAADDLPEYRRQQDGFIEKFHVL
jgi:hypothetical protein